MAGTGIAPHVTDEQARGFVEDRTVEGSPLRAVMPHVAAKAIGFAVASIGQPYDVGDEAIVNEAEKWLVAKYVRSDFCGLCGRVTDHVGEH